MTVVELGTMVTSFFGMITSAIAILMEPPVVWFVVLGFAGAVVGTAKQLVPKKKAK